MTNVFTASKEAKISGAGRKGKYAAFTMPTVNGIIVAEFVKKDGRKVELKDLENGSKIAVDLDDTVLWAIDPKTAKAWIDNPENWEIVYEGEAMEKAPVASSLDSEEVPYEGPGEASEADDGEAEDEENQGAYISPDRKRFITTGSETMSGKQAIASMYMEGRDRFEGTVNIFEWSQIIEEAAKELEIDTMGAGKKKWTVTAENFRSKYIHLNHGQQRMMAGVLMNAMIKKSAGLADAAKQKG